MTASATFSANQKQAIEDLQNQIARMNDSVKQAVDAGLTIEITRASRLHAPQHMCWGDQMSPKITSTVQHS